MKTGMIVMAGMGALLLAQFLYTGSAVSAANEDGRFEGVGASANAVWVIDTQTGQVRKCTQEFADSPPACSAFSKS